MHLINSYKRVAFFLYATQPRRDLFKANLNCFSRSGFQLQSVVHCSRTQTVYQYVVVKMSCFKINLLVIVFLSVVSISSSYSVDLAGNRFKKFYRSTDDFQKLRNNKDEGEREARKCGYKVDLFAFLACPDNL